MRVILPPSETKVAGGGRLFLPENLSFSAELGGARREVRAALEDLSRDEAAAIRALKLGTKSRAELAHNHVLATSGGLPAIERYTGVLFDALEFVTLDEGARSWVYAHVNIQSALFGLIGAGDIVPAYRLSASSRVPGLGRPLHAVWQSAHANIDWHDLGWVLDLRSNDYAKLAPAAHGDASHLNVVKRGPDGNVRALNHFNKAAKGELVRHLAQTQPRLGSAHEFVHWAASVGLEAESEDDGKTVTLIVT